jgi:hypothetical protein
LIEDWGKLLDAEKLRQLLALVNMNVKPLDRSLVDEADVKLIVYVDNSGYVELRTVRMDYGDAMRILERLKRTSYNGAELTKWNGRCMVYMSMNEIKKYQDLVIEIYKVLKRMCRKAMSKGRTRRMITITSVITNLNC